MPEIKVVKSFKYGVGENRRMYEKGERLIAKDKDARAYVLAKLATYTAGDPRAVAEVQEAPEEVKKPRGRPPGRAATATTATRKYSRRDMKAKK